MREITPNVELARNPEFAHLFLGVDAVNQHLLEPPAIVEAALDQTIDEVDSPHLAHQARVEAQSVDAVEYGLRGLRYLLIWIGLTIMSSTSAEAQL